MSSDVSAAPADEDAGTWLESDHRDENGVEKEPENEGRDEKDPLVVAAVGVAAAIAGAGAGEDPHSQKPEEDDGVDEDDDDDDPSWPPANKFARGPPPPPPTPPNSFEPFVGLKSVECRLCDPPVRESKSESNHKLNYWYNNHKCD